ncbi:similar to Saccharomyces cerevisiae YKL096W-A CWP2 Covalently linked cell wall mannoprotein, major constituent of the cell wall [Maudiozyma saulgeensis]|uniref:Similar to Saccharomyces cerevisiae YKL096W-A CWP2 Covalently linked cell wall mannoprotein, major constituent of the cell wall n=1 Tax=Maudiozyma saulgeensis TaxID=1789683 RepID=A0A1X7QZK4_9SACH|nr:similar to Saccharomyces cerevisiae YKL096W-A CWP2 Covalently linked cell wall mannoprotein, major constituent of the cell wall [Kazachstania saulgeensis]
MQFSTVSFATLFALAKFASATENKAAAISQITDGQIQATAGTASTTAKTNVATTTTNTVKETTTTNTATVHEQSSNGAGKQVVGFGAVAVAAALLL